MIVGRLPDKPLLYLPLCLLLCSILYSKVWSQESIVYKRLKAEGSIPEDFLLSVRDKYALADKNQGTIASQQKNTERFIEGSLYSLNQLLLSGDVLFNDPVSVYLDDLLGKLLIHDPDLKSQIRVYAVKSPEVNAYTSNNGIILVNLGLIARLENEAQLAFVLCHEVSHYVHKHPLAVFLQAQAARQNTRKASENSKGVNRESRPSSRIYSQEKELEADLEGFKLFCQNGYDQAQAFKAFDKLDQSQLPFIHQRLSSNFFGLDSILIPDTILESPLLPIQTLPSDQTGNYYPATPKRKKIITQFTDKCNQQEPINWKLDPKRYEHIQQICRFEVANLQLYLRQYERAIYSAYVLGKKYGQDILLDKITGHSLYALTKYHLVGKFWDVHQPFDQIVGYPQQLNRFFERINERDLLIISLSFNWKLFQRNPQDEELKAIVYDLSKELASLYGNKLEGNENKTSEFTFEPKSAYLNELNHLFQDSTFMGMWEKAKARIFANQVEKITDNFYQISR